MNESSNQSNSRGQVVNEQIIWFEHLKMQDVDQVGGKNASLGEMISGLADAGVSVPGGFATTAHAFREFLRLNRLAEWIDPLLKALDVEDVTDLAEAGKTVRQWVVESPFPEVLEAAVTEAYKQLTGDTDTPPSVAVRSSATAEDLPDASFAGQQETFLNVQGLDAVMGCNDATETLQDGQEVAVSCAEGDDGFIYEGLLKFSISRSDVTSLPEPPDKIMMNVANPSRAFAFSRLLEENGLKRVENGLRVIMMCELPSNAIQAKEFLAFFDGFSIGSNDISQLILGLDWDSGLVAKSFYVQDSAFKQTLKMALPARSDVENHIGMCAQRKLNHANLAKWLVERGIQSVYLNLDTVIDTWLPSVILMSQKKGK